MCTSTLQDASSPNKTLNMGGLAGWLPNTLQMGVYLEHLLLFRKMGVQSCTPTPVD